MVMPLGHQCAGVLAHSGINQFSCTTLPKCKYHLVLSRTQSVRIGKGFFCNCKKHKSSLMSRFWADKCRIMSHYYICWPALCHSAGYWGLIAALTRTIPFLSSSNDPLLGILEFLVKTKNPLQLIADTWAFIEDVHCQLLIVAWKLMYLRKILTWNFICQQILVLALITLRNNSLELSIFLCS